MTTFAKKQTAGIFFLLLVFSCPAFTQFIPEGTWQGALSIQGMELRMVFHITKDVDGSLKSTCDSPDQGAKDIPVKQVTVLKDSIIFDLSAVGGIYQGRITSDTTVEGVWKQRGYALPLVLKKSITKIEIRRPQEPKKPYPYIEEEVTIENKNAGCLLAGTLTRPMTEKPVPAVVLITGSGPQDRDEMIFNHRPFWIIADYLTRRGIAVLRCDDRGVAKSTGNFATSTSKDFATDVLECVRYLTTRPEIDRKKIGLIGHSEGGIIAPLVASKSNDVAFIVLLAGTGVTGEEILYRQTELISKAAGASDSIIALQREGSQKLYAVLKAETDTAVAAQKLRRIILEYMQKTGEAKDPQITDEAVRAEIMQLNSPWFRFFLTYDPRPVLQKIHCPVLALNGGKDVQVDPEQNLPEIGKALKAGRNRNYEIKELQGLNHLFQTAEKGSPAEYAKIEETFSPEALTVIGDWIHLQTKP